jgi:2-polyprenyl-3-methyl-5-hydroxy-6-metoxy-1,4-benzoquinol methylase
LKAINENTLCPLCLKSDTNFLSDYPGTFLSCKELHWCKCCGIIYGVELPEGEELKIYYSSSFYVDQISDPFNPDILKFSKNLALTRLSLIKKETNVLNEKCKILDIGAGNASFGIALQVINNNAIYDVVEPDTKVRAMYGGQVNQQYSDITDVVENNYDLAVLNQVLEHLPEPIEFIQSICELLRDQGVLYIDVPFKDYLFKPSVEPHILFWSPKSLSFLIEKIGMKLVFCDTVGMTHEKAKKYFFNKTMIDKIQNPWSYANKLNQIMKKLHLPQPFDTFKQFHANEYGGDRQWLRCIAQKVV